MENKIEIGKRIKQRREQLGMSQEELGSLIWLNKSTIQRYESGKITKIKIPILHAIAKQLNVDPNWLVLKTDEMGIFQEHYELYEDGTELQFNEIQKAKNSNSSIEKLIVRTISSGEIEHIVKYRTLDRYGKKAVDSVLDIEYQRCSEVTDEPKVITLPMAELKASAGTGQWLGDDEYTTRVDVVDTPEARRANVVIEVSGDSMEPQYHDGDKVLVKLQPFVEQNEIGIFIVDNCGYIKKLGVNELISANKEYDSIPLSEYNEVTCVGKVLGIAEIVQS